MDGTRPERKERKMRKVLEIGGIVAAAVLIAFGIASIVMASSGRDTVSANLKTQQITGTPDMASNSKAIAGEVAGITASQNALVKKFKAVGVTFTPSVVTVPGCSVAGDQVADGSSARCFAQYMFIHAMGATSGLVYSQMGRYMAKPDTPFKYTDGGGALSPSASDAVVAKYAQVDATTKQPVANGARNLWIDQVALSTALNASYMAEQISLFGLVVGIALLLSGIGFGILAVGGALRSPQGMLSFAHKAKDAEVPTTA
jgi:F0F1-type ATP synthase membrane subunit c/vacuolar-type H+-ATPase subunit K